MDKLLQFAFVKLIGLEVDDHPAIFFLKCKIYYSLYQEIAAIFCLVF